MKFPTISELPRLFQCGQSMFLPQARRDGDYATRGTALHKFLSDSVLVGRDEALKSVPPEFLEDCLEINFEKLPKLNKDNYSTEVSFALNLKEGTARAIGENLNRNYKIIDGEMAGTADLVGLAGEKVVVWDFKTGNAIDDAKDSWQLRGLAVAAALAYGKNAALVGMIYVRNGTVSYSTAEFDAIDLAGFLDELRMMLASPKPYRVGDHCRYCPSFDFCPVKTTDIKAMVLANPAGELQLTPETAGIMWSQIKPFEEMLKRAKKTITEMALHERVPIPGGGFLVVKEVGVESLDGGLVYGQLVEKYGPAFVNRASSFKISKASLARACAETKVSYEEVELFVRKEGAFTTAYHDKVQVKK